jgi:glycosyltransferase involved in cell wall biosynthesis
MKKILWLASWYPSKLDPFLGDFVQRHAQAVSLFNPVEVIYVIKDDAGVVTSDVKVDVRVSGNLRESIVYYKPRKSGMTAVDRLLSIIKYIKVYKFHIRSYIRKNGVPSLVHVHVTMWAGVLAKWMKSKYNTPYFITEHWTGYDKLAPLNYYKRDYVFRCNARKALLHASLLLPASRQLGQQIQLQISPVRYEYIPNVVDTRHFRFVEQENGNRFRFIHISTMGYQKNAEGLLRVLSRLMAVSVNWEIVMVGPASEMLKSNARRLGLNKHLFWRGEIEYKEVAIEMQQSSAMVMFSRYENQPCVILEAQCCGLPVVATAVGGISEVINHDNGILVQSENEEELLRAMMHMMDQYHHFDRLKISTNAVALYNYERIGQMISNLYHTSF